MIIKRDKYLKWLIESMHSGSIKIITGIRRCGKSYLLNEIFRDYLLSNVTDASHIIRFAFDSGEDLGKIGENQLEIATQKRGVNPQKFIDYVDSLVNDDERYYLLLDEVQLMDAFEYVLNGYLAKKNLDIYVTGSNSRFLSSDVITEFRGRGEEIHMLPLTFSEYYSAVGGDKHEAFDAYCMYGGLPAVALLKSDEAKYNHLRTNLNNLYIRDILNRYRINDDRQLSELLDVVSSNIGSLTNPRKLSASFASMENASISEPTIDKYLRYFEDSFLVKRAKRYDVKGKKYINTPFKVYFEDIGLRNARLDFRQNETNHIMENIIFNELRYRGYLVDVGVVEAFSNDQSGKTVRKTFEVDFVANKGPHRYYIQSAYMIRDEEKYIQETASLSGIDDSFQKIIVTGDTSSPKYDKNGFMTVGILEFLLNDSLLA